MCIMETSLQLYHIKLSLTSYHISFHVVPIIKFHKCQIVHMINEIHEQHCSSQTAKTPCRHFHFQPKMKDTNQPQLIQDADTA